MEENQGTLPTISDEDAAAWSRLVSNPWMTADGHTLAYVWCPYEKLQTKARRGSAVIVVRDIATDTERRYDTGFGCDDTREPTLSRSGRWLALVGPSSTAIFEIASGKRTELPAVKRASFVGSIGEYLLTESAQADGADSSFTLSLRNTESGDTVSWPHVREYSVSASGAKVAWIDTDGAHLATVSTDGWKPSRLALGSFRGLLWSHDEHAIAILRMQGASPDALVFAKGIGSHALHVKTLTTRGWNGFPEDFELDSLEVWRSKDDGVFFNIRPRSSGKPAGPESEKSGAPIVWHWKSPQLPPQQSWERRFGSPDRYLAYVPIQSGQFVPLSDGSLPHVVPQLRGQYTIGYEWKSFGWTNDLLPGLKGGQFRNYFLVDLRNGARRSLVSNLRVEMRGATIALAPRLSPDGTTFLYQNGSGDYIARELSTGTSRNLTAALPTRFYLPQNDPKRGRTVVQPDASTDVLQGWTADGEHILLSDYRDVWALPLHGGTARNLTGGGSSSAVAYSLITGMSPAPASNVELIPITLSSGTDETLDLAKEQFFCTTNMDTGETGLARLAPGGKSAVVLTQQYAYTTYYRAGINRLYRRSTSNDGGNYYLLDEHWQPSRQLTDLQPQQRKFQWPGENRYLTYKLNTGETSHAVILPPVGATSGQPAPTIVIVYERWPGIANVYPDVATSILFRWQREGYAVLLPNIEVQLNDPGGSAVRSVTAAIDAAVATGLVAPNRLGLNGYSYGGYETNFLITQTNLFKAAVAEAGMSNLISDYGAIYASGRPKAVIAENSQPYIEGSPWASRDAFIANSPLFHVTGIRTPLLLMHGDKDQSVPFDQSVELFNALRRLQDRPVVLIQYVNASHGVPQIDDSRQRKIEFFNHFLKGSEAPAWWAVSASGPSR